VSSINVDEAFQLFRKLARLNSTFYIFDILYTEKKSSESNQNI